MPGCHLPQLSFFLCVDGGGYMGDERNECNNVVYKLVNSVYGHKRMELKWSQSDFV